MSRNELGTLLAGALATVASLLGSVVGLVRQYGGSGLASAAASFKALLKSPAAWIAVGIIFVVGYSAGYLSLVPRTMKLDHDIAALHVVADANTKLTASASTRAMVAEARAKELEDQLSALQGNGQPGTPVAPRSARVAAKTPQPPPKAPVVKTPASAAPAQSWIPWER